MVGQRSTGVKDKTLPSLLNQMQIKLKAAKQQISPPTASLWTLHNPLSFASIPPSGPPPLLIVLATELRERAGEGDRCFGVLTIKII